MYGRRVGGGVCEIESVVSDSSEGEDEDEVEVGFVGLGREVDSAWCKSWVLSAVTIATRAPERISGRKAVGMSWP